MQRIFGGLVGGFVATALVAGALVWAVTTHNETVHWIFKNGVTLETGTETALTVTASDTGSAMVVLPENSIGGNELAATLTRVIFCGELAENGTTYLGPSTGAMGGNGADLSIGSTACDALDNTTEATADAPLFTNIAFKVMGFYCKTDGTLGAGETLTYTLRTAAADVVTTDAASTTLSCVIAVGETDCRELKGSTTNIAAGATIAMQAVEASNNADDNGWCEVTIALR